MIPYITDDDIVDIYDNFDSYYEYCRTSKRDVWPIIAKDGYVLGFIPNKEERSKVALKHSNSRYDKAISDKYNYHNGEARAIRYTKLFGGKVWPERMQKANDRHQKNMENFKDKEYKASNFNESKTTKITKSQLKEMILKEAKNALNESDNKVKIFRNKKDYSYNPQELNSKYEAILADYNQAQNDNNKQIKISFTYSGVQPYLFFEMPTRDGVLEKNDVRLIGDKHIRVFYDKVNRLSIKEYEEKVLVKYNSFIRKVIAKALKDFEIAVNDYLSNDESNREPNVKKITKSQLKEMILKEAKNALNEISLGMIGRASGKAYLQRRTNQKGTMLKDASERINKKYQPLVINYNLKHSGKEKNDNGLKIYVVPEEAFKEEKLPMLHIGVPSQTDSNYTVDPKSGEIWWVRGRKPYTIEEFKREVLGGEDTYVRKVVISAIRDFIELMANYNVARGNRI